MLLHLTPLDDWLAHSERPYAPASLALEGFVHCSPDEETVLAVANARYRAVAGPLMVLLIDESRLDSPVRWEPPAPAVSAAAAASALPSPPDGDGRLFPHIYGPVNRGAVAGMLEVLRDADGRWSNLSGWS
ncbi:DUF952 domain-containing protein [Phaeacidiphilus oryzae]|jgi:uncharacterized protein (DUF952 family)|uniref:DUF952 domain-containing protein n=1 Tax=Phaeacidiphilus oryzae TaxID=348818 RepID=UPI00056702EB|nr:DUF952 domain-containing protein [Phaeacidiphilus oryzae]